MGDARRDDGRGPGGGIDLSVVIPIRDEASNLGPLAARLGAVLDGLGLRAEVLFVDDGSRDESPSLLRRLRAADPRIGVVTLSRNFGHQAALSAGLDHARGRAVVAMDGDLQDPPELIPALLDRWHAGFDVAYAVRRSRREAWPKRLAYRAFYRLLGAVADLDIPLDSGDFGLMDRRVVDALGALPERARFVRGLRTFVGFRQVGVPYDRDARHAGTPKYTLRKLVALAVDGIVSFSGYPLRLLTYAGLLAAALAAGLMIWVAQDALIHRTAPRGWASVIGAVLGVGGLQMVGLGIIGEYVRLIFLEAKGRPSYIVGEFAPARPRIGEAPAVVPGRAARRVDAPATAR